MKAEYLMDAMGRLDEQLLAESLPAKRRNFRPLVAVAAVAAALAVTAGAAYLIVPEIFYYNDPGEGPQFAVRLNYGGTAFTEEQLDAFVAAEEAVRAEPELETPFQFATFEEMERYLKVDLLESHLKPVEECFFEVISFYAPEVRPQDIHLFVYYAPLQGTGLKTDKKLRLSVYAYLAAEEGTLTSYTKAAEDEMEETAVYQIENLGVTATLASNLYGSKTTAAWFVKDGIGYEVEANGISIHTMCGILETFHY